MFNIRKYQIVALLWTLSMTSSSIADEHEALRAHWRFDESTRQGANGQATTREESSGANDKILGFHEVVSGVRGNALRLGGINSYVEHSDGQSPFGSGPFSIEAWIALGAYPVHWCPIVAQADESNGIVFGIDAYGRLGLQVAVDGAWHSVVSDAPISLGEWAHVACTFQPNGSMGVYLNGKLVDSQTVGGQVVPAPAARLLIGRHPVVRQPLGTLRPHATGKTSTFFDGLLDELKIYDRPFSAAEIADRYTAQQPSNPPQLPVRQLPSGPTGKTDFGASYATLKYYDAWDYESHVGDAADVVVQFDNSNCKFVLWRGTSYIPHWVTENGIWYNNEFVETWNDKGCHEPMSDKECRYSHVRILESSPTRTVVQWRYALADNWYEIFRENEPNNRGEWVEETHTIYPDTVGVRKIVLYSSDPMGAPHEWNEAIVVVGPGQRPEDALQSDAVTLANLSGEQHTYSWIGGPPGPPELPHNATIEIVNTKSKFKPFLAVPADSKPAFDIYAGEQRPEVSMFPWWNHWPTALDPCDGRYAMAADRASHSSLTHCTWEPHEQTDRSLTKIMLQGLSDKPPTDIARLVRSWDSPPNLSILQGGFASDGYDPSQRIYRLSRSGETVGDDLTLRIEASDASPMVNLAILVQGWGNRDAAVKVDGNEAPARVGHRSSLNGRDLLIWLERESISPIVLTVNAD